MRNNQTAGRSNYLDKLKDPRWQKMRLDVFVRDQWACQLCGDTKSTLNVHHLYYLSGQEPWEYPLEALHTLCETCHTEETEDRPRQEKELLFQLKKKGFFAEDLQTLTDGIVMLEDGLPPTALPAAIRHALDHSEGRQNLLDQYFAFLSTRRGATGSEQQ